MILCFILIGITPVYFLVTFGLKKLADYMYGHFYHLLTECKIKQAKLKLDLKHKNGDYKNILTENEIKIKRIEKSERLWDSISDWIDDSGIIEVFNVSIPVIAGVALLVLAMVFSINSYKTSEWEFSYETYITNTIGHNYSKQKLIEYNDEIERLIWFKEKHPLLSMLTDTNYEKLTNLNPNNKYRPFDCYYGEDIIIQEKSSEE